MTDSCEVGRSVLTTINEDVMLCYVKRVNCDKTKDTSVRILIPYERSIWHPSFLTRKMVGGECPL